MNGGRAQAGPYTDGGQSRVAKHSLGEKDSMTLDRTVGTSLSASTIHGLLSFGDGHCLVSLKGDRAVGARFIALLHGEL